MNIFFTKEQMSFVDQYLKMENAYCESLNNLKALEKFVGYRQLIRIYSDVVSSYTFKTSEQELKKHQEMVPDDALMFVQAGENKYKIILDFINDYGPGEYYPVNKLFDLMTLEASEQARRSIDLFEEVLYKNSIKMYGELSIVKKKAYPMLETIRKIKPKNNKNYYMYQFPHSDFKEYRLGLIAIQV